MFASNAALGHNCTTSRKILGKPIPDDFWGWKSMVHSDVLFGQHELRCCVSVWTVINASPRFRGPEAVS